MHALLQALLIHRLLPHGFTNRELRTLIAPLLGTTTAHITAMTYDLRPRRLRAHGLIARIPHTRRYQITDTGLQHALLFTHAHDHLLRTGLAEITHPDPPIPTLSGSKTWLGRWPAALGGPLVLADQPSEDRSAPDSLAVEMQGGMIGAWRAKLECSMWPSAVVVGAVPREDGRRCRSPKIRMRSVSSVLAVRTKRSAKQFARGHRGGIFTVSIPAPARTASNEVVNWPARSRTRNRNGGGTVVEVHQQVTGLLGGPGSGRMAGRPEDVHVAAVDFEGEEDVDPFQRDRAVDVEEVHGQHAGGLRA